MAHSITFMSLVEDVKSAESAAMKFLAAGDRDRMDCGKGCHLTVGTFAINESTY